MVPVMAEMGLDRLLVNSNLNSVIESAFDTIFKELSVTLDWRCASISASFFSWVRCRLLISKLGRGGCVPGLVALVAGGVFVDEQVGVEVEKGRVGAQKGATVAAGR